MSEQGNIVINRSIDFFKKEREQSLESPDPIMIKLMKGRKK